VTLQKQLAGRIDTHTPLTRCELVAGADVSYNRFSNVFYAGVVVLRMSDLTVVETRKAVRQSPFPYIPGLLSFREAPALLEAFSRIESDPDLIMVDGAGIAHPRRIGIASHLGLWLERPCVGCAKSRLTGTYEEPGRAAGSSTPLLDKGEVIGRVVRTKNGVKPLFISVGHRIDLDSAVRLVLQTCRGYRLPEPTRQAHLFVNEVRREAGL
jgi:deoxyribonuclease V